MKIETIRDVLRWTSALHQHLAQCASQKPGQGSSPRVGMLLDYLVAHEKTLSKVIDNFERGASLSVLNTWCYDYLENHPVKAHDDCAAPLGHMGTPDIIAEIERQHNHVINLYKHLRNRVDTPSAQELIDQLIDLEEHEAMRMNQSANRLEDL